MVNDMVPTKEMLNEYLHSELKNVDAQAEIWYWAGIAAYAHLQSPGSDEWKREHGFSEKERTMTKEEFKAKVSMALGSMERETWEDFLEAVWQLHLEASNQWIPIEERLPKRMSEKSRFSETVLVYNKEGFNDTAYYDYEEKIWRWLPGVTHWMEIVPPRKEDRE